MKRIISILVIVVCLFSVCAPSVVAEDTTRYQLEINPENRYTDISEMDDYNRQIFANEIAEADAAKGNKLIYIVILCVLLVVAVVVLIVSLRRTDDENNEDDEKSQPKSPQKKTNNNNKNTSSKNKPSDKKKSSGGKKK